MTDPIADPYAPARDPERPPRGRQSTGLILVLLLLIAVNLALMARQARLYWADHFDVREPLGTAFPTINLQLPAKSTPDTPIPSELALSEHRTIQIFRQAAPSVVFITTVAYRADFFRRDVQAIPQGTGSGFVWDEQGHIVTNYHVIRGASAAQVTLADQRSYPAELVGKAPDKDLAVLRIVAQDAKLEPLPRGSSADLLVGQQALAIGNPFGLDHTLSVGVISGLGREIKSVDGRPIQGVIQTDAAINPGNSGGPLLDSRGRLVGINTAIYSPTGASAGIGFAVPVDTVVRFVPELIAHGRITRPGLGIAIAEGELTRRLGVDGVLVMGVQEGSAAAKAGLRATTRDERTGRIVLGDVLVEIDKKTLHHPDDLFKALDAKKVGDRVKLGVKRHDQRIELYATLQPLEPSE